MSPYSRRNREEEEANERGGTYENSHTETCEADRGFRSRGTRRGQVQYGSLRQYDEEGGGEGGRVEVGWGLRAVLGGGIRRTPGPS